MAETNSMLDGDGIMIEEAATTNKLKEVEDDPQKTKSLLKLDKAQSTWWLLMPNKVQTIVDSIRRFWGQYSR